jgi:hypothetical protein
MGWKQQINDPGWGTTFIYGQIQDNETGLCLTASQLGGEDCYFNFNATTLTKIQSEFPDYVDTFFYASPCSIRDDTSQLRQFFRLQANANPGEPTRDPLPHINFIGVPQSSNPNGVERYAWRQDASENLDGDYQPSVVASHPKDQWYSGLGYYDPQYTF